jgi:hypothetical protein
VCRVAGDTTSRRHRCRRRSGRSSKLFDVVVIIGAKHELEDGLAVLTIQPPEIPTQPHYGAWSIPSTKTHHHRDEITLHVGRSRHDVGGRKSGHADDEEVPPADAAGQRRQDRQAERI